MDPRLRRQALVREKPLHDHPWVVEPCSQRRGFILLHMEGWHGL
jgi:hypothetical protein